MRRDVLLVAVLMIAVAIGYFAYNVRNMIRIRNYLIYHMCDCFSDSSYVDLVGELNDNDYANLFIVAAPDTLDGLVEEKIFLKFDSTRIREIYGRRYDMVKNARELNEMLRRAWMHGDTTLTLTVRSEAYKIPWNIYEKRMKLYMRHNQTNIRDTFLFYTNNRKFVCFDIGLIKLSSFKGDQKRYIYD